jgi:hypothetical protein
VREEENHKDQKKEIQHLVPDTEKEIHTCLKFSSWLLLPLFVVKSAITNVEMTQKTDAIFQKCNAWHIKCLCKQ